MAALESEILALATRFREQLAEKDRRIAELQQENQQMRQQLAACPLDPDALDLWSGSDPDASAPEPLHKFPGNSDPEQSVAAERPKARASGLRSPYSSEGASAFSPASPTETPHRMVNKLFEVSAQWTGVKASHVSQLSSEQALLASDFREDAQKRAMEAEMKEKKVNWNFAQFSIPMTPNARPRLIWDIVGLVLVIYDLFAIPFVFAFEPEETKFAVFMSWFTLLFWSLDIVFSNLVGFYENGELIMSQSRITWHYLQRWFIIDMLVVMPDWVMKAMTTGAGGGGVAGITRLVRVFRVVRVLRLLRLLKLARLMDALLDLLDSEYMFILFTMVRLVIFIIALNHVIACIWFLVGKMTLLANKQNWLEHTGAGMTFYPGGLDWQYLSALHWSLTQFTPASMDVVARNVPERIVSIIVVFFALITFSSVVGSVTSSMTALRTLGGETKKQFWLLRRYMKYKHVDVQVRVRIIRFLEHHTSQTQEKVNPSQITILKFLSEPLQNMLAYEMNKRSIIGHPLFESLNDHMRPIIIKLSHSVLKFIHFAGEDVLFRTSEDGSSMYFVKSGSLQYCLPSGQVVQPPLREGASISEPVLWTPWLHRGELKAEVPCELTVIQPAPFAECMGMHPSPWNYCKRYATCFIMHLNTIHPRYINDLTPDESFFPGAIAECDECLAGEDEYRDEVQTTDNEDRGTLSRHISRGFARTSSSSDAAVVKASPRQGGVEQADPVVSF